MELSGPKGQERPGRETAPHLPPLPHAGFRTAQPSRGKQGFHSSTGRDAAPVTTPGWGKHSPQDVQVLVIISIHFISPLFILAKRSGKFLWTRVLLTIKI